MGRVVHGFLGAFRRHRWAFHAILVQNRSVPEMRARGNDASRAIARAVRDVLRAHAAEIAHPDVDVAADMVFRTLFALGAQRVMFDDREVSGRDPSLAVWERELAHLVLAYLRAPAVD